MRILLVDDHTILREGMARLLADALEGATFGHADSGGTALAKVRRNAWDLVILDLSMPGRDGLETLKDLRTARPRTPILVFTMFSEEQYALRCIRAGATGYVNKAATTAELVLAAKKLLAGGRYVSAALAEHLAAALVHGDGRAKHEALSDRELQVLRLLATGQSVKEIAFDLKLSNKTISTYRTRILDKMQMRSAAQLVRYAIRSELVE